MWASRSLQLNGTYGYFFAVYGLFSELAEGAERALVIDLVPDEWRGRALGAYRQRSASPCFPQAWLSA